jgi:hypothetical protein
MALVRTDVWEELIPSIIKVTSIGELGTMLAVISNRNTLRSVLQFVGNTNLVSSSSILVTLKMEAMSFSETSVLTRATRCNVQEDGIFLSHRSENLKS